MSDDPSDVFIDAQGAPRRIFGVTVYSGATRIAELAGKIGFDVIWIEMEHGPTDFAAAENLCMAAQVGGALPAIRLPDNQRHHVLRALEIGARILIIPMINTPEQAKQIVAHGKYPPLGSRGYNTRTRGVEYGLAGATKAFAQANERTRLFAQIETLEAVKNLEAIASIDGLSGVLIGPGDLSVSAGMTGDLNHPNMIELVTGCVKRVKALGKHVGIFVAPGALLDAAIHAGCDLVFCGGDLTNLIDAWGRLIEQLRKGYK